MSDRFHLHPDGIIYVEKDGVVYSDTVDNAALDFGTAMPVTSGDVLYRPESGKKTKVNGRVVFVRGPWPPADALILKVPDALRAQRARRSLQDPQLGANLLRADAYFAMLHDIMGDRVVAGAATPEEEAYWAVFSG